MKVKLITSLNHDLVQYRPGDIVEIPEDQYKPHYGEPVVPSAPPVPPTNKVVTPPPPAV